MINYFTRKGLESHIKKISDLEQILKRLGNEVEAATNCGSDTWHDNAAYDQVVIDIRGADNRLKEAYNVLNHAKVIEYPRKADSVSIGTRVKLIIDGQDKSYEIVGYGESDPSNGKILYCSPLALVLKGHHVGDIYTKKINGIEKEIEINEISPLG